VDNIATRRSEFYDRIKKIERPAFTNSEGGGVLDSLNTCRLPGAGSTYRRLPAQSFKYNSFAWEQIYVLCLDACDMCSPQVNLLHRNS
jgi:hypothetical protein